MTKQEKEQLTQDLDALQKMMYGMAVSIIVLIAVSALQVPAWAVIAPTVAIAVLSATVSYRHNAIRWIVKNGVK
jgi:hypothetical protein